jgi:hypothetical protein
MIPDQLTIFRKRYDGESCVDVSRDVWEAFDEKYNPLVKSVPVEDGFHQGVFTVTVTWSHE